MGQMTPGECNTLFWLFLFTVSAATFEDRVLVNDLISVLFVRSLPLLPLSGRGNIAG